MKVVHLQQGSPEWLQARVGVITASRFKDACERTAKGLFTAKASTYAAQTAIEIISGQAVDEQFVTWQMKRGIELEPAARLAYEQETGLVVEESGIAFTDDGLFGYSTDGFIGTEGGVEFKSLASAEKIIAMWADGDISDYEHQIQGGMWITDRKWIDFVMYAPHLDSVGKALFIKRIHRDAEFITKMLVGLSDFEGRVLDHLAVLRAAQTKEAA